MELRVRKNVYNQYVLAIEDTRDATSPIMENLSRLLIKPNRAFQNSEEKNTTVIPIKNIEVPMGINQDFLQTVWKVFTTPPLYVNDIQV